MKTEELIAEINDLPVEQRAEIASQILQGLNAPAPGVEEAWMDEVEHRARQVDSGEVSLIPGEQVLKRLRAITKK
jgi:putative addiction module component (TIGR02574 family)